MIWIPSNTSPACWSPSIWVWSQAVSQVMVSQRSLMVAVKAAWPSFGARSGFEEPSR